MKDSTSCLGVTEFDAITCIVQDKLPEDPADLWDWCLDQNKEQLLEMLAYCAGASLNAVETKHSHDRRLAFEHADTLANCLNADMTKWFKLTADTYFSRISRHQIEDDMIAALGKVPLEVKAAKKKADAAKAAEKAVANINWLPEPVTIATPETEKPEVKVLEYFPIAAE
ncbi:hypothetical protein [Maritalea sp.]|uniref:hypothetical protein n=1 Tax=Maritalea sp. TaxID=2003361 RepID=UPI003EF13A39